jgi:ACS family tartrate transporter-like MFS transporter
VIGFVMAAVVVLSALHSDLTGERRLHVAVPLVVMACGLTGCVMVGSPALSLMALAMVPLGMGAIFGPFWALPTTFLRGTAAAGGLAMVASVGNVGGFIGPIVIGFLKDRTGSYHESLLLLAVLALVAAALAFGIRLTKESPDLPGNSSGTGAR